MVVLHTDASRVPLLARLPICVVEWSLSSLYETESSKSIRKPKNWMGVGAASAALTTVERRASGHTLVVVLTNFTFSFCVTLNSQRLQASVVRPALVGAIGGASRRSCSHSSYLVDPASSHMLVSKIKPCMSKYKLLYTVKLRTAHYISNYFFDGTLLHGYP